MIQDLFTSCGAATCLIRHLKIHVHLAVLYNMERTLFASFTSYLPRNIMLHHIKVSTVSTLHTDYNKHLNACHSIELYCWGLCCSVRIPISCCILLHVNLMSSLGSKYSLKCCWPSCDLANKEDLPFHGCRGGEIDSAISA